jgi:UDP-glucose 4-epimerase
MKIVVTGGAGFIGSNVVDAYIGAGHEVVVIDNLSSGSLANLNKKARFYLCDIRSKEVERIFEIERPQAVNHHAAQISVPESVNNPIYDAEVNVLGFLNIMEASRKTGVKKAIFISSGGAIYGEVKGAPVSEKRPPEPFSPYAVSKAVSEDYLKFYNSLYGIDYTILRYANIYGPRQVPHGEAGVVAIFMDRLVNKAGCTIYHFKGEPRGMVRDYCYVGDIVRANLLALSRGSREAFNIGTGRGTHTRGLFDEVYSSIKKRIRDLPSSLKDPNLAPARPGDLKRSILDAKKALKGLGWRPLVDLRKGMGLTLEWRLKKNA